MTSVHFVAAVGFILMGFFIQKAAMESKRGSVSRWLPMIITALSLGASVSMVARYNTGDDTLVFLIWFFAAAVALFLLIGMILGKLIGRIMGNADK